MWKKKKSVKEDMEKGMIKKTYVKEGDIEEGSRVNGTSKTGEYEGDAKEG